MVKIPIRLIQLHDHGFHLLVEVVVFERAFLAVLDTGASHTVFDKETIEACLPDSTKLLATNLPSTGLGTNNMESFHLIVPKLHIGIPETERISLGITPKPISHTLRQGKFKPQLILQNFEVAAMDLSTINFAYSQLNLEPVIGVIGGDVLMQYGGIVNYQDLTLILREKKRAVHLPY